MDDDFLHWCAELLAPLGRVRHRRMFGGHGLYLDEVFVALVMRGCLYLKVDDDTEARFEAAGSERFSYTTAKGVQGELRYRSAPDEAMDSPAQMAPWARLALASALRAQAAALPKPRRQAGSGRRRAG